VAGRLDEAIDQYREALRLKPDYAVAHNNLGNALVSRGSSGDALQHFREAVRLDPSNAEAHYNVGSLLRARGELASAGDEFRAALALKPEWIPAVASLAWLLATAPDFAIRDPAGAVSFAERAADLTERRDASALDILAAAYASAGRFDEAIAACDLALTLNPDVALERSIRVRQALYRQRQPYRSSPDARN